MIPKKVIIAEQVSTQTKSRTNVNYWMLALLPENAILLSEQDANRLGLNDGDTVRVSSPSNIDGVWDLQASGKKDMVGKLKLHRPSHRVL